MKEQILIIYLNGSYYFETVLSTTPWKKLQLHIIFSFFFNAKSFFKLPKENEQKRPLWALPFRILPWLQPSAAFLLSAPFTDAERVPASHPFPLYLVKGLAPSSLLLHLFGLPCPTCSLSKPAKIRRKRSSSIEFPASSCSGCKIPQSECWLSLSWRQH